jgi:hypothetical protein
VGAFYIDYETGHVATHKQLREAGLVDLTLLEPAKPWFRIKAPIDANTMWYAVMRKQEKGIYLGTLTFRHQDHFHLLLSQGWEEIPVDQIGTSVLPEGTPPTISPIEF